MDTNGVEFFEFHSCFNRHSTLTGQSLGSSQGTKTFTDGRSRMGDVQIHVGTLNAFPLGSSHQYRAQWPHGGEPKGSNSCDLFGAWFWFKPKKAALSNICLLLLCMPSSPCTLPIFQDGPEGWTYNKPFVWYQFPYPAVYHGPASATPAKLRLDAGIPASSSRYLWAWSGTGRGNAAALRKVLMAECSRCTRLLRE